jgi:hypothetical protein
VNELEYRPDLCVPVAYQFQNPSQIPTRTDQVPREQCNDLVLVKQSHRVFGGTTAVFDTGKFNACVFV